ncbi:bifunctional adenosylcobinamide kinase/adenosylcobinamide-phosphate guanylyltransferase [Planococcus salinus]|uniref:Adenosylcobinamide kinase n=1 Tax=Planococcus salinus TaxID=1848460 RepID=A0A3M8P8W1_9BACL|nr:bifunctional adenosylcobinamide kinase/adenosylcobinamide-phosphate guanylyltransferase [Planococcus salinus]RNF40052.1 cobinamide kinase [Planococcus salinus]
MAEGKMIFISGGVRSGKSAYAERRLLNIPAPRYVYLASGQARDPEMEERILRHQKDRQNGGWTTVEQPLQMEHALLKIKAGDAVLWDCVTTWLANELYEGWQEGKPCTEEKGCMEAKWRKMQDTMHRIREVAGILVIVSNEVLDDFVRDESYQKWLGEIHRWIVAESDEAFEMENGVAYKRK